MEWCKEIVKREIYKLLYKVLPESYNRTIFAEKTETVCRDFYELAELGRGFAVAVQVGIKK
jgi:hypothetical protein